MERVMLTGLIALACLRCDAQTENKITQEKVEQTSKRRATLAIPGRPPNQKASLRVECLHTEETVQFVVEETDQFTVVLDEDAAAAGASGAISRRVRIDEGAPATHEWTELPDHKGYAYSRYPGSESSRSPGLSPESRKLLEDARIQKDTLKFLGELLAAKTVRVELSGGAEAQFNVAGLRAEFDNSPECKAYYRISK
jgi:hypothetical protein